MTDAARKIRLLMELRRAGVSDTAVLGAIERTPREAFVPESFQDQAWEDIALPIGHGQTISQPRIVAMMTETLKPDPKAMVLEVGCGSGYQAAILARLFRRVYTIERLRPLLKDAEARFARIRLPNIVTRCGDGTLGWPEVAPFDRILVTAAGGEDPPPALLQQLVPGGIMLIPLATGDGGEAIFRFAKSAEGEISQEELWPVRFVPLVSSSA